MLQSPECRAFREAPNVNPVTGRPMAIGGPRYRAYVQTCGHPSGIIFTRWTPQTYGLQSLLPETQSSAPSGPIRYPAAYSVLPGTHRFPSEYQQLIEVYYPEEGEIA